MDARPWLSDLKRRVQHYGYKYDYRARAIDHTSQVQQLSPAQLYQAVSQVLNYVLQLNAFRDGRRQAPPRFPNEVVVPSHLSEVSAT